MPGPSEPQGGRLRTRPHPHPAHVADARWRLLAGLAAGWIAAATTAVIVLGARSWGVLFALFVVAIVALYKLEPER